MKEQNYIEISERLKEIMGAEKDVEIARGLGVTPQSLHIYKKQGKFPSDLLIKFCMNRGLSIDWLLTGKGPRERGEGPRERERLKAGETVAPYDAGGQVAETVAPYGAEANVRRLIEEAVVTAEDLAKAEGVSLTKEERAELVVAVYDELVIIEERKSKELKTGKVVEFFKRKRAS